MPLICDEVPMAKKKTEPVPPPPQPEDDAARVTVLNLKGSVGERDFLKRLSRTTGVSASEIARRGMAMWAKKRGTIDLPDDWIEER